MKPILITGFARSGTKYMSEVLKALGYKVAHEEMAEDIVVSYRHLPFSHRFQCVAHQTRHPLSVLRSFETLPDTTYQRVIDYTGLTPNHKPEEKLKKFMWCWLNWCKEIDKICILRYRVEELEEVYDVVFGVLQLPVPDKFPQISKTTNTWKALPEYTKKLTWKDLENADSNLCRQIKELAKVYGYEEDL